MAGAYAARPVANAVERLMMAARCARHRLHINIGRQLRARGMAEQFLQDATLAMASDVAKALRRSAV
jgi:hypothetical protein